MTLDELKSQNASLKKWWEITHLAFLISFVFVFVTGWASIAVVVFAFVNIAIGNKVQASNIEYREARQKAEREEASRELYNG